MLDDHLRYLFHCYFHEDWDMEAPTWQGVVAAFVESEPGQMPSIGALGELSIVLESPLTVGKRIYDEYSISYMPLDGSSMSDWLLALRDQIGDEMISIGRPPKTALDDVLAGLEMLGIRRPTNGADDALERAAQFGATAPIDEIIALLGALSVVLAPSATTDASVRSWLKTVRTAAATGAVPRWPRTARHVGH